MRDCEYYREKISCLIDGELNEQDTAEIMAHIAGCSECRALYNAFSAISSAAAESMVEPPERIVPDVMREVKAINAKKKRGVWIKSLSAAACIALVVLVGAKSGMFNAPEADKMGATDDAADASLNGVYANSYGIYRGEESEEAQKSFDNFAEPMNPAAQSARFTSADGDVYYVNDSAELEKLMSLMSPLGDVKSAPVGELDYKLVFDCGDEDITMDVYIEDDLVFADSGDGPYAVTATPEEIRAYLK